MNLLLIDLKHHGRARYIMSHLKKRSNMFKCCNRCVFSFGNGVRGKQVLFDPYNHRGHHLSSL